MNNFNLKIKQLDYLYNHLWNGIIGISILSLIIFITYQDLVPSMNLTIWFSLNVTLLTLRILSLLSYKKNRTTNQNYLKRYWIFFTLSSLTAALWGSIALVLIPTQIEYTTLLLIFVFGLVSSAAVSLSSRFEIFFVYLILGLSPFLYTLIQTDHNSDKALSFAIVLYIFILSSLSKKVSDNVKENIQTAFENQDLLIQLEEKVEEAKTANRAKSDFLSVMSHEIRTPLNAIMGFVQILKKGETDKKKYKYLNTIDKSSKTLTNIINDILDLSKIESGKFTLEMTKFAPKEEFNSLYLLFEQNALEKGVNLIDSISKDLPNFIKSDILRVKQIVSNLLSNAVKFTQKGKNIELIVNFNKETSSLHVEVRDEGIGISKDNLSNITKAFTQADSSTARKYGGTGLGLSIVKSLLELFNTHLKIESELKQGSVFSFEIVVEIVESEPTLTTKSEDVHFTNKKVLVAEDNKTNQMLIDIILNDMDLNVTIVQNGQEAINIFKKHNFDILLMDINMPIKNGTEAMKEIKEYEKEKSRDTPIIALTANAVSGDREKYLKEGFDGYISKPIETPELIKVLQEQLN